MAKYQVVATTTWEIDSENPYVDEIIAESRAYFYSILKPDPTLKTTVKVDRLRVGLTNIILGIFKPEDVLAHINHRKDRREYVGADGQVYKVRMNSQRYFVFRANRKCVCCGLEGTKMILEAHPGHMSPHFNFYAEQEGQLILMTKDHIRAKAFGGEDRYSNYQTMCAVCNNLKAAVNLTLEGLKGLRRIYDENRKTLTRKKLAALIQETRDRLAVPRPPKEEKHVRRINRNTVLAAKKAENKVMVPNVDLNVWKTPGGQFLGRSVYETLHEGDEWVACIKRGLEQEVVGNEAGRIALRFNDVDRVLVYQGYLEYPQEIDSEKNIAVCA